MIYSSAAQKHHKKLRSLFRARHFGGQAQSALGTPQSRFHRPRHQCRHIVRRQRIDTRANQSVTHAISQSRGHLLSSNLCLCAFMRLLPCDHQIAQIAVVIIIALRHTRVHPVLVFEQGVQLIPLLRVFQVINEMIVKITIIRCGVPT